MKGCGVTSWEAYVLAVGGNGRKAVEEALASVEGGAEVWRREGSRLGALARGEPDSLPAALREVASATGIDPEALLLAAVRIAGRLNGRDIVRDLADDPRYHAAQNQKPPRRIESVLGRYDCVNCDLCVSACPNDAIFIYATEPVSAETERLRMGLDGGLERSGGEGFVIGSDHQIGVFEGACNECSNCETYCPEEGAPFRAKERFFPALERFEASRADGYYRDEKTLWARIDGREHRLEMDAAGSRARLFVEGMTVDLDWEPLGVLEAQGEGVDLALDTSALWRMRTAWDRVYHSSRPNPVNPGGS